MPKQLITKPSQVLREAAKRISTYPFTSVMIATHVGAPATSDAKYWAWHYFKILFGHESNSAKENILALLFVAAIAESVGQ